MQSPDGSSMHVPGFNILEIEGRGTSTMARLLPHACFASWAVHTGLPLLCFWGFGLWQKVSPYNGQSRTLFLQ